ncbi:hypothetical protein [Paraburkholderia aromaticivorans]|uniref:Uncharacterized protein n=1 Tax=Paraburkholderia aromaticivorans TaxID=2026199 RepID=A0A248VNE8_9BURK|nr:hypothetical protein [Paraburkholderia aromaticivorans]ASW00529.1 hypothetical protein CJU94_19870 [Paraburkholderia aromaticivorans]
MFSSQTPRSCGAAVVVAATVLLSACGGSGGGSASTSSNVLKLSSAVQSEHVARYAGAFGMLSGPGVAVIYTSVVQSLVSGVTAGTPDSTTACPVGGSISVATQSAGASGLQGGETATVSFNQCVGQVKAPGVSTSASVTGTVSVQIQSSRGVVGNASNDWSYSAVETANALTLTAGSSTTVVNGTVSFTMSYDAKTGVTTTTASAPTVTLDRSQPAGSGQISGTITITSLTYSRVHGTDPVTDTLATSGNINVNVADAVIAFSVATPTPVTISGGNVQAGVIQLSTSDTVETITPKDASTVGITVTSNGQTGTYTESVDTFRSLVSG